MYNLQGILAKYNHETTAIISLLKNIMFNERLMSTMNIHFDHLAYVRFFILVECPYLLNILTHP